jgi:branched-chain amino acid transport system permease protein
MIYGVLKVLHIAHGGVYALGAYIALFVFLLSNNFLFSLLAGIITSGLLGISIYCGVYKRLLNRPRFAPLIASIGLLIILEDLYRLIAGPYRISFLIPSFFPDFKSETFVITSYQIIILTITLILSFFAWIILEKTKIGLGLKATSQDQYMAAAVGVNINRTVLFGFFIGSALAGAGGILQGIYFHEVFPTIGSEAAVKGLALIVFGGFGSILGAVIASFILGISETFIMATIGFVLPRDAIAYIVMILILIIRPYGLLGKKES